MRRCNAYIGGALLIGGFGSRPFEPERAAT